MPITNKRLTEFRLLLDAATPGPWEGGTYGIDGGEWGCVEVVSLETIGGAYMQSDVLKLSEADAALIAAAPTAIAELVAEVEAQRRAFKVATEQTLSMQKELGKERSEVERLQLELTKAIGAARRLQADVAIANYHQNNHDNEVAAVRDELYDLRQWPQRQAEAAVRADNAERERNHHRETLRQVFDESNDANPCVSDVGRVLRKREPQLFKDEKDEPAPI